MQIFINIYRYAFIDIYRYVFIDICKYVFIDIYAQHRQRDCGATKDQPASDTWRDLDILLVLNSGIERPIALDFKILQRRRQHL